MLLPSRLLGDRAAEPRQIEPREAAIGQAGGAPKDSPDGALLVTGLSSLKCFGEQPGVALMRFRFRPELGEGCGGRRYLQARIWLVRFADWREHAGDILHCASEKLAAVPDVARKNDNRFAQPAVQIAVHPPAQPDPDAAVAGLAGGQTLAGNRFAFMAMVYRLLEKSNETDVGTFGGNLFPTEDAFVLMAGHALRQVYHKMKSWRAHDDLWLASRLRLPDAGKGLTYLSSREIEPRAVKDAEWEAFKTQLRPAVPAPQRPEPIVPTRERKLFACEKPPAKPVALAPPSGATVNRPARETHHLTPGFPAGSRDRLADQVRVRNLAAEPQPKQVSGTWSNTYYTVSPGLEGDILGHLQTWEHRFLAYAADDGDPAIAKDLLLASAPIASFLKTDQFERLHKHPDFMDKENPTWNYLRLVLATQYHRPFAKDFSFRELLALAPLHNQVSRAECETNRPRNIIVDFMDGAVRLVLERIRLLKVLWPTELEAVQRPDIAGFVNYHKHAAGVLSLFSDYCRIMTMSDAFNDQWNNGHPRKNLVTGIDDDRSDLGNACQRIIDRDMKAVEHGNRFWQPTKLPYPPSPSDLTKLDFDRPRTDMCPANEVDIIEYCKIFIHQTQQGRENTYRLSRPASVYPKAR